MISNLPRLNAVPVKAVTIDSGFWGARQATNRDSTIPAIHHQMDITGRIDAWHLDWQPGQPKPHIFWDSDAGKWIEAVAYSLMTHPNPEFERQVDEIIDLIEKAQQPDGYLNIYFTAVEPENRWTQSARLARTVRRRAPDRGCGRLLSRRPASASCSTCSAATPTTSTRRLAPEEGKKHGYPGHPELELALVKLYHATGEQRYLKLVQIFH